MNESDASANRLIEVFNEAESRPAGSERERYLAAACGDDGILRAQVDELLRADEQASGFINPGAAGSPEPEPEFARLKPEEAGEQIGPYKLREQIGEGGFGTVWVAEQEVPVRRRVAMKILKLGMDTKEVIARFEQERQALALMDHPNIARVIDAGATQFGRPFFVMELVRGVKITQYCDEQELSTAERVELFIAVCHAVQHAHQKGIIHRDLKPSNILVTVNDGVAVPKVIDFGVAKATLGRLTEHTVYTQFQQMIGTPIYMSPEQAEMTSLDIDTRSDVFSLGVLLYELLTGHTPIEQETIARVGLDEIRRIIREVDPPRPSMRVKTLAVEELTTAAKRRHIDPAKLPAALRGDIDWIVMKCLEKDRKRRYNTASGLALDLQRHLANEVVTARPPTTGYLLGRLIRRNRLAFAAGVAIALSLIIGMVATGWQLVQTRQAEQRVVATLEELRATAPAFAEQARALAAKERYDEAVEKLDYALKLRPDAAEYLVAKGDLLRCQLKLSEAAAVYREALRARPGFARAETSAKLCDELLAAPLGADGKLSRESLAKLHLVMQQQQRPAAELMPVARLLGEEKKLLLDYWLARLKDLPVSAETPLEKRLTVREDGRLSLDLSDTKITDLSPLAGTPLAKLVAMRCSELTDLSPLRGLALVELFLSGTSVSDLTPLREMHTLERLNVPGSKVTDLSALSGLRLRSLDFQDCAVTDVNPIRHMPLEAIGLAGTRVSDLSPLIGMPIKTIELSRAPVLDFSPLAQLPLEKCYLQQNRIADLSVLQGKPLKELVLWGCVEARNYAVLREIKTLELLLLPSQYRSLPPEDYAAIGALRDHPSLRQIGSEIMNQMGYAATGAKDLFWHDWDREQTFVPAIRKAGYAFSLTKIPDGSYQLTINRQSLSDLSFLKDAPLGGLNLLGCKVVDLSPIRELRLRYLWISENPVVDLAPLRAMPLESLSARASQISDLSPLAGLPLKQLYLDTCPNVTDVSVLAEISTLERLTVPMQARNIEKLQKLPNLQMLDFRVTGEGPYNPRSTVRAFWDLWPTLTWVRTLNEAGIKYTARQNDDGRWAVTIISQEFSNCSIFKDAAISELVLSGTRVTDLRPFEGLALTKLDIRRTAVTDLSPLRAPALSRSLREVYLSKCKVTDFSPLAACTNLELLDASQTVLADLSIVRGRKLRHVQLMDTNVTDISVLAGMPLTFLTLSGSAITDISPLLQCPTLRSIVLPNDARDVISLRTLSAVSAISYESGAGGEPKQTAAEFWKTYEQGWQQKLREMGLRPKIRQSSDGTWDVKLGRTAISDLSILSGAQISMLDVGNTAITDLTPLRGMPLKVLWLYNAKVADLSPLKGMQLDYLHAAGTLISDISVLRGMPLRRARFHGCFQLTDLSPLAEAKELTELTIPEGAKDFEFLRNFPKLEHLSYWEAGSSGGLPNKTAAEFWKEYDAKKK